MADRAAAALTGLLSRHRQGRPRVPGDGAVLGALAVVSYVPLLLTAAGRVASDTKSYLYLDPGRLLSRAVSMWDPHVGMGTVTHQNIGYLFPMGPFFWAAEVAGLPDWLAQRLWLGSILFAAGAGVWFLLRDAGLSAPAIAVASFAYALTPYTLTHAGKHSVVLLPFSGLPWLLAFTQRSVRDRGWAAPAAFALVALTIGGVNATALVLVGLAPLLWLGFAWSTRESSGRDVVSAALRIGGLTLVTSLWWMAGLWAQGAYGLDVLQFTETAETVADASVSVEVLRSLGYWFFYGRDRISPWVSASAMYTQRLWVIAASFAVPVLALVAGAFARWRERSFYVALLAVGVFAAVGAHPWGDPPLGGRLWKALLQTDGGLALRSTPRAVPLVALSLAVLLGSGVAAASRRLRSPRPWLLALVVVAVVAAAMPPLFTGGMIDETLQRDEEIPIYWQALAAHVDAGATVAAGGETRVLEVPGIDFAAYRWGTTVDPITPGLIDRPYVAREVVPHGSAASADLLRALDRRLQENVLDPAALAPIARLMGVGTIVSRNDIEYERYRTARPYAVRALLDEAPGIGPAHGFGDLRVFTEHPTAPLLDELFLAQSPGALVVPPVAARPVEDPVPIVRAKRAGRPVVVAGDGEGLVAAASAGLLDGDELVRYSAAMPASELANLPPAAALVLTDSNRRRGNRWYTVRENTGYTESIGEVPLVEDASDSRLGPFGDAPSGAAQTVVEHRGGVVARATSYGNPTTLTPEYRPANAVDGDPSTVWRTGAGRDVRGERIVLSFDAEVTTNHLRLRQLGEDAANRTITEVQIVFDSDPGTATRHRLGPASQVDGQRVDFPERTFRTLSVEITADSSGRTDRAFRQARWFGLDSVGFAEIDVEGHTGEEILRLPLDLPTGADRALTILLERLRADPAERVRRDEEPELRRTWTLEAPRSFALAGAARLSAYASDDAIDRLVSGSRTVAATSSRRLDGDLRSRAASAVDGSADTAWMPGFGAAEDWIEVRTESPVTISELAPVVLDAGTHSLPRQLRIETPGDAATVELPPAPAGPDGLVRHPPVRLARPLSGTTFRFTITAVEERMTTEWFSGGPIRIPPAVVELGAPALTTALPPDATELDDSCRSDLVSIDGRDVRVRVLGTVGEAIRRSALPLEGCDGDVQMEAGEHTLTSAPGTLTGIDVDRLLLRDDRARRSDGPAADQEPPPLAVRSRSATRIDVEASNVARGEPFWLVLGQSNNAGWHLEVSGASAGPRSLVDGYANGWLVTPHSSGELQMTLRWRPQRVVWGALAASVLGVLVCLALLIVGRRRPRLRGAPPAGPVLAELRDVSAVPWQWAAGAALAVGAGADIAVGPVVAVVAGAATYAAARSRAALLATRLAAPGALAMAAAFVLARQLRYEPEPALEWPGELVAVHQVAWSAVMLLVAVVVADRLRRRFGMSGVSSRSARATSEASRVPHHRGDEPG